MGFYCSFALVVSNVGYIRFNRGHVPRSLNLPQGQSFTPEGSLILTGAGAQLTKYGGKPIFVIGNRHNDTAQVRHMVHAVSIGDRVKTVLLVWKAACSAWVSEGMRASRDSIDTREYWTTVINDRRTLRNEWFQLCKSLL